MALYLTGFNSDQCFATPEPLGSSGDSYPAIFGQPDQAALDQLVRRTPQVWNAR